MKIAEDINVFHELPKDILENIASSIDFNQQIKINSIKKFDDSIVDSDSCQREHSFPKNLFTNINLGKIDKLKRTNTEVKEKRINLIPLKVESKPENPVKIKCNCKKSQCLKLYCECFQTGVACVDCNCENCSNVVGNAKREETIVQIKSKNNNAFKQVPEKTKSALLGCNCSKSFCVKKYCECFNKGASCSDSCRCLQCKNQTVLSNFNAKTLKMTDYLQKGAKKNNHELDSIFNSNQFSNDNLANYNGNSNFSVKSNNFQIGKTLSICVESKKINITQEVDDEVKNVVKCEVISTILTRKNRKKMLLKTVKKKKVKKQMISPQVSKKLLKKHSSIKKSKYGSNLKKTADHTSLKRKKITRVMFKNVDNNIRKKLFSSNIDTN